jgi:hypothetical protein
MLQRALAAAILVGLFSVLFVSGAARAEDTKVVALGLTHHKVSEEELKKGDTLAAPHFNTPGVAYALLANVKKGDSVEVALKLGDKPLLHNIQEVTEDQPSLLVQAGKTGVPAGGWPAGTYTAWVEVKRAGKTLLTQESKPQAFE